MKMGSGGVDEDGLSSRGRRGFLYQTAIVVGALFPSVLGVERARADGSTHGKACCGLAKEHSDTCHSKEHSACPGWVLYWECQHGDARYWRLECYVVGGRNPGDHCSFKNNVHCSRAVHPDERGDLVSRPKPSVPEPQEPPETPPEENPGCGGDDSSVGVSVNVGIGDDANDGGESTGIPWSPEPGDDPCDPVDAAKSPTGLGK